MSPMMSKRAAKPTMAGAAIQASPFVWDEPVAVGLAPDAVTLETISVAVVVTRTVTCDMVEDGVGGGFKEEAETDCAVIPLGDSVFDLGVHLPAGAL